MNLVRRIALGVAASLASLGIALPAYAGSADGPLYEVVSSSNHGVNAYNDNSCGAGKLFIGPGGYAYGKLSFKTSHSGHIQATPYGSTTEVRYDFPANVCVFANFQKIRIYVNP